MHILLTYIFLLFLWMDLTVAKNQTEVALTEVEKEECKVQAGELFEKCQLFVSKMQMAVSHLLLSEKKERNILTKWEQASEIMKEAMESPDVPTCRNIIPDLRKKMDKLPELKSTLLDWGKGDPLIRFLAITVVYVIEWTDDKDIYNMIVSNSSYEDSTQLSYLVSKVEQLNEEEAEITKQFTGNRSQEQINIRNRIQIAEDKLNKETKRQEGVRLIANQTLEIFDPSLFNE